MTFEFAILSALLLLLLFVVPYWRYSRDWGYWPATVIGVVLLVLLVMTLAGLVPR